MKGPGAGVVLGLTHRLVKESKMTHKCTDKCNCSCGRVSWFNSTTKEHACVDGSDCPKTNGEPFIVGELELGTESNWLQSKQEYIDSLIKNQHIDPKQLIDEAKDTEYAKDVSARFSKMFPDFYIPE